MARSTRVAAALVAVATEPELAGSPAPADVNGILGSLVPSRRIAFVIGLIASLFDDRFGLAKVKPTRLTQIGTFPNDDLDGRDQG